MTEQERQLKRIADALDKIKSRFYVGLAFLYGIFLAICLYR